MSGNKCLRCGGAMFEATLRDSDRQQLSIEVAPDKARSFGLSTSKASSNCRVEVCKECGKVELSASELPDLLRFLERSAAEKKN